MKKLEFIQTASHGGFPAPNDNGFEHGEGVYVISKADLDRLVENEAWLRTALRHAALSLESIWMGRAESSILSKGDARWQVREYARDRSEVAFAALAAVEKEPVR